MSIGKTGRTSCGGEKNWKGQMIKPSWVRDWGGQEGAGSWEESAPALEPIHNNFLVWISVSTLEEQTNCLKEYFCCIIWVYCWGKAIPSKEKYLSVSDLFMHQISFNFFHFKDTGDRWSQRPVFKPSTISTSINRPCCLPRLGWDTTGGVGLEEVPDLMSEVPFCSGMGI